jgi:hypothetical protein
MPDRSHTFAAYLRVQAANSIVVMALWYVIAGYNEQRKQAGALKF